MRAVTTYSKFIFLSFSLVIAACSGLTNKSMESGNRQIKGKELQKPVEFVIEQDNLNASIDGKVYAPDEEEVYNVVNINKGLIESFNGDINNWWTGEGGRYVVETSGGALKVQAKKVGPRYDAFGSPYPNLDFRGGVALRVRARSEGAKAPLLRIDLRDANGFTSNAKPVTNRIMPSDKFTDYYFVYGAKLKQAWPDERVMDPSSINQLTFFLNPGSTPYTGTVYIDEVRAVPVSEASKAVVAPIVGAEGGMIENFEDGIVTWWCGGNEKADSPDGHSLRITANKVGPAYDAFGRTFDPINFNVASTIRVRAKVEATEAPNVRLDLKDPNGYATNGRPNVVKFDKGEVWTDYYFPFKGRFTQTWPNYKKVDPIAIQDLLFFVNAGKSPWSGKLYIKEIEAILPLPEEDKGATSASGKVVVESPSTIPGIIMDNIEGGTDAWWIGSDKFEVASLKDKIMQVKGKDVGPDYETFGRGFETIDFNKTPIVAIRAMVEEGQPEPDVRFDVKDSDGHVANGEPIIIHYKADGKFRDYFYDFRGKFFQTYPDNQTVNPSIISEMIFFVNPGAKKISTTFYIEDIKAITPEEYQKALK